MNRCVEGPVYPDGTLAFLGTVQANVVLAVDSPVDLHVDLAAGADVEGNVDCRVECISLKF